VFSDYGGESNGDYYVYSVLVCGYGVTGVFNTRMKSIRTEHHHLGDKEIAFKDFGMGQLLRALPDYLAALNHSVPGFLCSVVVDKKLTTLFGSPEDSTLSELLRAVGVENVAVDRVPIPVVATGKLREVACADNLRRHVVPLSFEVIPQGGGGRGNRNSRTEGAASQALSRNK
jgi:hypothetical protein